MARRGFTRNRNMLWVFRSGANAVRASAVTEAMACPGVDLLTVSRWLRHKSVRTSERHYLATSEKRLQHAVAHATRGAAARPAPCDAALERHVQRVVRGERGAGGVGSGAGGGQACAGGATGRRGGLASRRR